MSTKVVVERSAQLETQRLVAEARASELEDELNVKSLAVEDLLKTNAIL